MKNPVIIKIKAEDTYKKIQSIFKNDNFILNYWNIKQVIKFEG